MALSWPRAVACVAASAGISGYFFAGDLIVYLAILLVLFVLSPGGH